MFELFLGKVVKSVLPFPYIMRRDIMEELPLVEQYRKELYRIGWRIQYRARVISNREIVKEEREFYTTKT
jgi:hypothetical protein